MRAVKVSSSQQSSRVRVLSMIASHALCWVRAALLYFRIIRSRESLPVLMIIFRLNLRKQEEYFKIRYKGQRIHHKVHISVIWLARLMKARTMAVWVVVLIYSRVLRVILWSSIKRWWPKDEKVTFYFFLLTFVSVKSAPKIWLIRYHQFQEIRAAMSCPQGEKVFSFWQMVTQPTQHSKSTINPQNLQNPLYWTIRR